MNDQIHTWKKYADADRDTWEGSLPSTPEDMRSLRDAISTLDRQMLGPLLGKFTLTPDQYDAIMAITGFSDEQLLARGIVCVPE
jgi:hypothetical protein